MTDPARVQLAPGYSISAVINGCWQLTPDHGGGPATQAEVLDLFADLVDHGFTTFDCADIYTGVEDLLGRFRRGLADPDHIQIHTKLVPDKATLHQLSAQQVDAVIDRSLGRLGVDCLDLVQFHWWDPLIPGLELLLERLQNAQRAGKIRHLGATNFNSEQTRLLLDMGVPLVSLQAQYSLLDRRPEKQMTALAVDRGVGLLPYGVLAGGYLGGKYLGVESTRTMNRSLTKYRLVIDEAGGWETYQDLLNVLSVIASRHHVPMALVAARWVLDQPGVKAVILGVGTRSRAAQNRRLTTLVLDNEDREMIRRQLNRQKMPPGDMYDLERDENSPHSAIIKTNLQQVENNATG